VLRQARSTEVDARTRFADGRVKQRIGQAAYPDSFTLIDLRPIRPLVFGARHKALDADLVRVIHGFDSLLGESSAVPPILISPSRS
jgi:hypothetical protein